MEVRIASGPICTIMCCDCRGATPGPESNEVCTQLQQLKKKLANMEEQERLLEEQCEKMQVCLKNAVESISDKQYPFCGVTL